MQTPQVRSFTIIPAGFFFSYKPFSAGCYTPCLDAQTVISLAFHVRFFARMRGTCTRGWTCAALHEFLRYFKVLVGMFSFHLASANPAHSPNQTQIRSHLCMCTCTFGHWLTFSQTLDMKNLCSAKHPQNILIAPDTLSSARELLGY